MSISYLSSETLAEFVRREGPVTTRSVAYRFQLDMGEARRRLKLLRSRGEIASRREPVSYEGGGSTALVWEGAS